MGKKQFQEIWDYCSNGGTLGQNVNIKAGKLKNEDRPEGECWACKKFAEEAMIHESPGTAECCKECDGYLKGE